MMIVVMHISESVWWKAKIFDANLKNAGHVFKSKISNFIVDQVSKMDTSLKTLKALVTSCTKLFPMEVESLEEDESSSSYSDLIPHDIGEIQGAAVEGENQYAKKVNQVEDITAITALHVLTTEMLIPNATPISTIAVEEIQDDSHMAEVTPPRLAMTFQVVARDPPPLAILAPGFPLDSQLSAPLAPDVAETVDHVEVNLGSDGHDVSVSPPRALSLATDRADRHEGRIMHKKEVKLKKRKNRE